MVFVRLLQVLLAAALLSGCTFFFDAQDSVQPDPEPNAKQQQKAFDQIKKITQSMKNVGSSEVSAVGPNEAQSGPEKWTACSRANFGGEQRYFTFFLKGETVVTWRAAVINDRCETRAYTTFENAR